MKILLLSILAAASASGDTIRFERTAEPREGAFTILVPAGWRTAGGIVRVNPMAAGGPLNSIAAKLDFSITSPDGRITLRWFPETNYFDTRGQPAQPMFPPGSNYNGALVWPKMDAQGYLRQVVFPKAHPQASQVTVKGRYPLPSAVAGYQQVVRLMRIPIQFHFDATLLVVTYREGANAWEEALYTAVQDWGPAGAGLWTNKDTFAIRAPLGELERTGRMLSVMLNSVELNPRWVRSEIRGQMRRNEIAIRTQQEIERLDREIVAHRQRTNAEINNQMFHNLAGSDEYVNPLTNKTEIGSAAWSHRWVNERGDAIYSDDERFDPLRAGHSGFVRSPVRPRSAK